MPPCWRTRFPTGRTSCLIYGVVNRLWRVLLPWLPLRLRIWSVWRIFTWMFGCCLSVRRSLEMHHKQSPLLCGGICQRSSLPLTLGRVSLVQKCKICLCWKPVPLQFSLWICFLFFFSFGRWHLADHKKIIYQLKLLKANILVYMIRFPGTGQRVKRGQRQRLQRSQIEYFCELPVPGSGRMFLEEENKLKI